MRDPGLEIGTKTKKIKNCRSVGLQVKFSKKTEKTALVKERGKVVVRSYTHIIAQEMIEGW